jgi:T4 gene Gp59 loader of gp41 DNA helicase
MMSAFECYKEYLALKQHFTQQSYDYFRYNGKVKANGKSFETRPDKLFFMKIAKHTDPVNFMLANLVQNEKTWVREMAYSQEAEQIYKDWLKRNQSLLYIFKEDLSKLNEDFDSNFKVTDRSHPNVIKLFLRKEISLETLVILVDQVKCTAYWSKRFEYDPTMEEVLKKIQKYKPFLKYDAEKAKNILVDKFA